MYQSLLATTSSEGLQPLGTAAQRSFELVSGAVRARLGEEHALIFAEPVAAQHGEAIDWHAPREGRALALGELSDAERAALEAQLAQLVAEIRAEAETLASSPAPNDQRLGEALLNALEIPGEDMIRAIRDASGALHPVLLHWAWLRDEQRAVRGVLSTLVARPAAPVAEPAPEEKRASPALWWLLLLGWLLLALMLAAILWLLVKPCGLWRTGPDFCPVPESAIAAALTETRVAADEVAALEREIALVDRGCQPTIPVLPAVPETAPAETPQQKTGLEPGEAERKAALDRAQGRGVEVKALTFLLEWSGPADIDLTVTCPAGPTVSRETPDACEATLALDANTDNPIDDPVEAVTFPAAPSGLYKVMAHLRDSRGAAQVPVRLHMFRQDGPSRSYAGMLEAKQADWTTNISISR